MKRPANLVYAPDEVPPLHVTAFNAIQHVGLIAINLVEFPERRPSEEEIRETDEGVRRLAGFMLRRNADRVRSEA